MEIPLILAFTGNVVATVVVTAILILIGLLVVLAGTYSAFFRKVQKGTALVRTGLGDTEVAFDKLFVFPILHRVEQIDISVKQLEVSRTGSGGLICKDNMRADIKVVFFVRVNNAAEDVLNVAQSIGCVRASDIDAIRDLFDAKFSEALKTVGKRFDFTELYEERDTFRNEIMKVIGRDLNGFVLDDAAIDYLEQTPLDSLDPNNILDSEGIKKITELTATQAKLANHIQRDKERVIKQQDVEAQEAILELERQHAEAEARQKREVDSVRAREHAEAERVKHEQFQRSEQARIASEEEIEISTENKERQVLVAQRNKERTDAVEQERVERDRELEVIERERITQLKGIDRDKAVETEKRDIQEVIKERVMVEKTVVEEKERIKDTEAFASADRAKKVTITEAEMQAQEKLVIRIKEAEASQEAAKLQADEEMYTRVKEAEAGKASAELHAEEVVIEADAEQAAAEKRAAAKKVLAEGTTAESAAEGLGEATVVKARGEAEAEAMRLQGVAEADSINAKAEAMKLFDEVGREHEEFKLELDMEKEIELAKVDVHRDVAEAQAAVMGDALKQANIDLIGGDAAFFDQIMKSVSMGKSVDRLMENSETLTDIKETFFNSDPEYFKAQVQGLMDQFNVSTEDLKNISIAALLTDLLSKAGDEGSRSKLQSLLGAAKRFGMGDNKAADVIKRLTGS